MKINFEGIKELMIAEHELSIKEFTNIKPNELIQVRNRKLEEESILIYEASRSFADDDSNDLIYEFSISGDSEIETEIEYIDNDADRSVKKDHVKLVFLEKLEEHNISLDLPENSDKISLKANGNYFGCLDDYGYKSFDSYELHVNNENKNIFFESESHGTIEDKLVIIIGPEGVIGSIDQYGPDIDEAEISSQLKNIKSALAKST